MDTVVIVSRQTGNEEKLRACAQLLFPKCRVLILPQASEQTKTDKRGEERDRGQHPGGGRRG